MHFVHLRLNKGSDSSELAAELGSERLHKRPFELPVESCSPNLFVTRLLVATTNLGYPLGNNSINRKS